MTRRETLETRVEKLASRFERIGESQAKYEIIEALLQVEREVWEKVERYYSHQIHYDMDDYPDKFVKWLKSQQQELK
jgi:hypothetical protein